MTAAVLRPLGAIAAGIAAAMALVIALELFSGQVHPFPEGFTGTCEELHQHVRRFPAWVLAVAAAAWGAAARAGAWTARRLGGRRCALFLGLLLLTAAIFNVSSLPYPLWFKLAGPIAIATAIASIHRSPNRHPTP